MQRYFIDETPKENKISLFQEPFHHMKHVMRNKVGDTIFLVDKKGWTYETTIDSFLEDQVTLTIKQVNQEEKELPVFITIASGFLKGEKYEWLVQKGTELGMQAFIGFPSQTSVVKWDDKKRQKKAERLEKIALEASQQSQRISTPRVSLLASFEEFLSQFQDFDAILIAYEEKSKAGEKKELKRLLTSLKPGQSLLAIFGPEGGITPKEMEIFSSLGGIGASLGPRILRGETAPLYLLSAASFVFELD